MVQHCAASAYKIFSRTNGTVNSLNVMKVQGNTKFPSWNFPETLLYIIVSQHILFVQCTIPGELLLGRLHSVVEVTVAVLCLTPCNPMDYGTPGFPVHGILQARMLERVVISFSRGASQLRDRTWVSCIAGRFFTIEATRVAPSQWCLF